PGTGEMPPQSALLFCNVEANRYCATEVEQAMGIDVARQNEEGFWVKPPKSSMYGLDYSPQALAACGGQPQAVVFTGPFPDGSAVCRPAEEGLQVGYDANAVCQEWCAGQGWIDAEGNAYVCEAIAWQASGAA